MATALKPFDDLNIYIANEVRQAKASMPLCSGLRHHTAAPCSSKGIFGFWQSLAAGNGTTHSFSAMSGLQAFGHTPGWAEGSVTMAENIVTLFFGASQPSWMDFGMCHLPG